MPESYQTIPYQLMSDLELMVEPLEVRGVQPQPGKTGTNILIRWKNLPPFENSWEPFDTIRHQFPAFNLEDKFQLWVADYVRTPIYIIYARQSREEV